MLVPWKICQNFLAFLHPKTWRWTSCFRPSLPQGVRPFQSWYWRMDRFGLGHFSRTGGGFGTPKEVFFVWQKPRFPGGNKWSKLTVRLHMFSNGLVKNQQLFSRSVKNLKAYQVRWFLTLKCPSLCNLVFLMPLNFKDPIITTEQTRKPWLLCFTMWICFTSFRGKIIEIHWPKKATL